MTATFRTWFLLGLIYTVWCENNEVFFSKNASFSDQMCSAAEVEFTREARGVLSCLRHCGVMTSCAAAIYHGGTCVGVKTGGAFAASSPAPGARYYKKNVTPLECTEEGPLLPAVNDTKFTDSSFYGNDVLYAPYLGDRASFLTKCTAEGPLLPVVNDTMFTAFSFWENDILYAPYQARLNNTYSYWSPHTESLDQYIQVEFSSVKVVTTIITQGDSQGYGQWPLTFHVLTSQDCITFSHILDAGGNINVFEGNVDADTHKYNPFPSVPLARCVRLDPQTWATWPGLRFELLGCDP